VHGTSGMAVAVQGVSRKVSHYQESSLIRTKNVIKANFFVIFIIK